MFDLPEGITHGPDLEDAHAAALDAFVAFSEASNLEEDPASLVALAQGLLCTRLPQADTAYYELEDDLWKARAVQHLLSPEILPVLQAGMPRDTPQFRQLFQEDRPILSEWDATLAKMPETAAYTASGLYPYWRDGQPFASLTIGHQQPRGWTQRERLVFLAVGRALGLALERAGHAQRREARLVELQRQHHALEAYAELGREVAFETHPDSLIQHATRLLFTLLPGAFVRYVQDVHGQYRVRAEAGTPVQEALWDALPRPEEVLTFRVSAPRRQAQQQPVREGGALVGVLEVTLREGAAWTRADQAVLETVAQHLGYALERAAQLRDLKGRHLALEDRAHAERARHAAGEAFSEALWRDVRREVQVIQAADQPAEAAGRAQQLLDRLDALVEYLEWARRPLHLGLVSLLTLVLAVRDELVYEQAIEWRLGALPVVRGDQALLHRALFELLDNAVRATRDRQMAFIGVWSEVHPEGRAVYVRDNDEGFEPDFAELLFEPEGPGRGGKRSMGLAVVKRLVERHGGRVWAEGQPGEGATFAFVLPEEGP